ncbi:MAG: cation diffusion facilitator family transporter [Nocardioidaceae bacterium]
MTDELTRRPDAPEPEESSDDESTGTVLLAGAVNLLIAAAKIVAGLLTGSAAMLAEGAHSVADTMNQVFLLTALRRSDKPPDTEHPFGYGKERYFWALLAAVGILVLGAGFSFVQGVHAFLAPEPVKDPLIAYGVLALAFLFEGASWLKAVRQLHREAGDRDVPTVQHALDTPDPTSKTVAFEDSAALVGIVLAALGVLLDQVTGSGRWDGVASVLIGALLIVVAYALGRQNMNMLIGEAVDQDQRESIRKVIADSPGVDVVVELLTMRLGPEDVLVAARVDVDDTVSGGDLEVLADDVEKRVRERHPAVRHIFLDPTPSRPGDGNRVGASP